MNPMQHNTNILTTTTTATHTHGPLISHHTNMIINTPCNQSSSFNISSSGHFVGGAISRQLLLVPEVQILEVIVAVIVFITIHSLRQKKRHGLAVWPFLGMLPSLLYALRSEVYEWITRIIRRQNGTFVFKGPWLTSLNCVVTTDPRNLEHLLKTKFSNFPKGGYFHDIVEDLLGDGIFSVDDETWRRQRKTASIEFHSAMFRSMTSESLIELVHSRLLSVLEDSIRQSVPIDLQDVLLRLTFDNVCMIAFGVDPGCLRTGLPDIPFARAFELATEVTVLRFITPTFIWKCMRFLNIGTEKELKRSLKQVDEFANEVIYTRKKELLALDSSDDEKDNNNNKKLGRSDLLTVFMRLKDDDGKPFSDKFLRDICVNFILAGRDTSSVALSWFFWLLYKNPDVEEQILDELCRILGEREDSDVEADSVGAVIFRPDEVKKMEYLQAALSEALRLYPSVPLDHKEVLEDDVFPDGTVVKKGTKVIYAIYSMGRMESIWGKDCREFKPERWLKDRRFVSESAYKFTAFNGGPRLCLGKDFAYYQMKFTAASIILRYRVEVLKDHLVTPKLALTLYMKNGLKVTLSRRNESEIRKRIRIRS